MQNLVNVSYTTCTNVKVHKKFLSRWYPVPLRYGAWLNHRNRPVLHLSYHAELGQTVWASVAVPKYFSGAGGPLPYDGGVSDHTEVRPARLDRQTDRIGKTVSCSACTACRGAIINAKNNLVYMIPLTCTEWHTKQQKS